MLARSAKFTKSKFFYALDFDNPYSLELNEGTSSNGVSYRYISVTYPAIWFKTKAGVLTVTEGSLSHNTKQDTEFNPQAVKEDALRHFDGRYGGSVDFQWNGDSMWCRQKTLAEMNEAQERLDQHLKRFPLAPEGYEGWYSIKD